MQGLIKKIFRSMAQNTCGQSPTYHGMINELICACFIPETAETDEF